MFALHQSGRNDWYRIRNQIDGPTQLHIYDEVGYFGVSASDLIRDLADVSGPLDVHINSPGGEVFDGIAIYNALLARRDVTTYIDGIAASIASVIAMAGNPVLVARQAQMMVHDGFAMAIGNAQDLRDLAQHLDRTSNNIAQIYSEHTGKPVAYWREIMKAETWYDAQEAIDAGLADRYVDSGAGRREATVISDDWDLGVFRGAARLTRPAQTEPSSGERWDPDGDGDDDSTPEGDTDHSHWAEDGTQLKAVPGKPLKQAAIAVHVVLSDGTVEIWSWDAGAAMAKCNSASDYRSICAGEKTVGDPDQAQHWALPHHSAPGAGPDKGGVIAALGRWNQTQQLKNKQAALSHLKAHASSLGLPSGDGNTAERTFISDLTDEEIQQWTEALKGA